MEHGTPFRAGLVSVVMVLLLLGMPPRAAAQATPIDSRWGVLGEVAERDFHEEEPMGTRSLMAFRWEVPGQQMSMLSKVGVGFSNKTLYALDPATGRISISEGNEVVAWVQADTSGALRFVDRPEADAYLERLDGDRYHLARGTTIVETTQETTAGRNAAKLVAAGKLRAADPALKGTLALSADAQNSASNAIAQQVAPAAEVDSHQPGWAGLALRDGSAAEVQLPGLQGAYVLAVAPDSPARAAGAIAGDIIVALDGTPTPNTAAVQQAFGDTWVGQQVTLEVLRGNTPTPLQMTLAAAPVSQPRRNADRAKPPGWFSPSKDLIRVGEQIIGLLESTDPRGSRWVHRFDEYVVDAAADGRYLTLLLEPGRPSASLAISQECPGAVPEWTERVTENGDTLSIDFKAGAGCALIFVNGKPAEEPYRILLREQTPVEIARFEQSRRDRQLAEQRRRQEEANQPSMFGAIVSGLAMGMSGYDGPLMNADGTQVNTLDVLNSANTELARQNAEGQARLQASIAYAQRQAQHQADRGRDIPMPVARNDARPALAPEPASTRQPPRKLFSWCRADSGARTVYVSQVGSRNISVDEQSAWRTAMEQEFRQLLKGAFDNVQCDLDDDGDFSYTRNSVAADNPAQVQWAPH